MKKLLLALCLMAQLSVYADEPPTYQADNEQIEKHATGAVEQPLTPEQKKLRSELYEEARKNNWTFNIDVTQVGKYPLNGYIKPPKSFSMKLLQPFRAGGAPLAPITFKGLPGMPEILDQGNCGSCVVAAFTGGFMWDMALRSVVFPDPLSMQHLMNCGGPAGQCSGDWGERVGARLEKLGCLVANSSYPYTARNGSCKNTTEMECFGEAGKYRTIDPSFESIMHELHDLKTIKVGVAADRKFMSYKSGIYNGFGSMGTNHYVLIVGAYCSKEAQDKDGKCIFNSKGQLAAGNQYGFLVVANSWGTWGDKGFIVMQFENSSGKRNNNIAGGEENAQVMDSPIEPKPKEPIVFRINNDRVDIEIQISPKATYSKELAETTITESLK